MKMKRLILILISCILVGCSSAPVGWGGTHEVILANEKSIAFIYDKLRGG